MTDRKVGILTGPTATGKSSLALELAMAHGKIEIINADSMLVYRGMNIGTAKPTEEELSKVPHHLVNVRNPDETFTAGEFLRATQAAIDEIHSRGNRALIVGGTGFYLKALLFGLWEAPPQDPELRKTLQARDPEDLYSELLRLDSASALRIGKSDRYRLVRALEIFHIIGKSPTELQKAVPQNPNSTFHLWVIDRPNSELHQRISIRTSQMLKEGFVDEVQSIRSRFPESRALQAVGYAQVCDYLMGKKPPGRKIKDGLEGLQQEIELATRQLVKRQRTWFRGQTPLVPQSQWFQLDQDRALLEEVLKSVYD